MGTSPSDFNRRMTSSCKAFGSLASVSDASRVENHHGAANLALMRKLALGLLKQHPRKDSIARKRKTAALDGEFLAEVLAGASKLDNV